MKWQNDGGRTISRKDKRFLLFCPHRSAKVQMIDLGAGFARNRIFYAATLAWRQGWCEPTERLAYVGPPLRRRTSATCGNLLTKTALLTFAEQTPGVSANTVFKSELSNNEKLKCPMNFPPRFEEPGCVEFRGVATNIEWLLNSASSVCSSPF